MKILLISFTFAPANSMGAVRVTKMAEFLENQGHHIHVLTASDTSYTQTLSTTIAQTHITRTKWFNLNATIRNYVRKLCRNSSAKTPVLSSQKPDGTRSTGARLFASIFSIPDNYRGWIKPAVKAGKEIINDFKPDIIIASGGPFSGFIIAHRLAQYTQKPWIADYRDLWSENHAEAFMAWRKPLDSFIEKRTVKTAAAITSISPLMAEKLSAMHDKNTQIIMNGYDLQDYPPVDTITTPSPAMADTEKLHIAYTGTIYHDFQNIDLLLKACALLPEGDRHKIRISLYGKDHSAVARRAETYGIPDIIHIAGEIPYTQSIEIQRSADLLLFLLSHGPQAHGIFTGKLFEYIGAQRPIIAIGAYADGPVCDLIATRKAGKIYNDAVQLKAALQDHITQKITNKTPIAPPPSTAREGLDRQTQFQKLMQIINAVT